MTTVDNDDDDRVPTVMEKSWKMTGHGKVMEKSWKIIGHGKVMEFSRSWKKVMENPNLDKFIL